MLVKAKKRCHTGIFLGSGMAVFYMAGLSLMHKSTGRRKKKSSVCPKSGIPRIGLEYQTDMEGFDMKGLPEERAIRLAHYIVEEGATVRQAAKKFGVSKSTVHKDITTRLKRLNGVLYLQVQTVLGRNKRERHIRGGLATREKDRAAHEQEAHEES